jgi:CHAT domain-containing protein/Tfp pilus assembly protein PilF
MNPWRGVFVCLVVLLGVTAGVWRWPVDLARPAAAQPLPTPGNESEQTNSQAEALLILSEEQNAEDHALARQTAQQALALWQAAGDNAGVARAHTHIGQYYMAQSDLPEAIENYDKALRLWRDLNNHSEEAGSLIMLGFIEARREEWSNSISFLTQAQDLLDPENDPARMGQIEAGLADIFNESGMPEAGVIHFQRALDYYHQTPNTRDDSRITLNLGVTYFLLGDNTRALTHIQQALASFAPDSLDAATCDQQLGRVYVALGENEAALQHLQSALAIYLRTGNPKEEAQVRALMGQVYQQQGETERARQKYQQALSIFDKLSDRVNQAAIYYALGRLELLARNYVAAESYLGKSIDFTEDIRRIPASSDLIAAFSATVHDRYETYIECLMRRRQTQSADGLVVRAFESSELGRSRSLVELLRATGTNLSPNLDADLAAQEKSLRQSLRVKEDSKVIMLSRAHKQESLDELEAELAQLRTEYKQVTDNIRTVCPSCEHITRPVAWTLAQIQQEVISDDETMLLEYSLGKEASYVWAVTRDRITSYELPSQTRIEEAALKVYKLLSVPPGTEPVDELSPAIRELSQMILTPVAAELSKRRIIVVADGTLNYIPFQVLQASPTDAEPLVAKYEIINAPSATTLGELRQEAARRKPAPKVLVAFGNPVFAPSVQHQDAKVNEQSASAEFEGGRLSSALRDTELNRDTFDPSVLQPLFYAKRELANLRELAVGEDVFVVTDFSATREQLLGTDLTQYEILHFATHGLLNAKRPESSGLLLSTIGRDGQKLNGFVGLQDIYSLRAPVDLVVLSACQTALGKDVRGEGLVGLTRGFMYAGASSVAATLWKVEDKATAELMKQFYAQLLQKGLPPGAAMREAQNNIRQRPYWRSPYYWAAFTLQGEYCHTIKLKHSDGNSRLKTPAAAVAGLATLLGLAAWWYRRQRSQAARSGG